MLRSILSILSRRKVAVREQKDIIFSMVRILAQMEGNVVQELLEILVPYFGEDSVLSVVEVSTRSILATTQEGKDINSLRRTAKSIKNTSEEGRYIPEEKNGVFFRDGYKSVCIYPFRKIGKQESFLMVEQMQNLECTVDRCIELLDVAVRMNVYENIAKRNLEIDFKTNLPSRDALIAQMKDNNEKDMYLGMFYLLNGDEIGLKEGIAGIDRVMCDAAGILEKRFPKRCFCVADRKLAVLIKGEPFKVMSALNMCLDNLIEGIPNAKIGCVLSPMVDEIYTAMYMCEKACEQCSSDVVIFIREPGEELNIGNETMQMMYVGEQGREVYEDFAEQSDAENGTEDEVETDSESSKTVDDTFFYDWSDMLDM